MTATPRMARYLEYSTQIYNIYLKYIAPEDIHVYSIDEVFLDVTQYLKTYGMTARELASRIATEILEKKGLTATAGIGTNLYLCKIAMDIVAKHMEPDDNGVRIAELDEISYRELLWDHRPLTDFWRVGVDTARSWKPPECLPWAMWPDALSEDREITITKICCTGCLASMRSFDRSCLGV